MEREFSIIPHTGKTNKDIENGIEAINKPLFNFIEYCGLPTTNICASIEERRKVISVFQSTIEILPVSDRQKAEYISKFVLSVAVGMFDGAISFIWDETIKELRKKIIEFDLLYFFSVSQTISNKYKNLSDESDIVLISDHDLLEVSRRIGLIGDINHKRLSHINYFRNNASAAHPNNVTVSGIELASFLENCLKYAICLKIQGPVLNVRRLLENIKKQKIPANNYQTILNEIEKLPKEMISDFFQAIFGIFCDPNISQGVYDNIKGIAPGVWNFVDDDIKLKIGSRFGYYSKNGDIPKKDRVSIFLTAVDGVSFKDEESLSFDIIERLGNLRSTHFSLNNFYNEAVHAILIDKILPKIGIPKACRKDFVKIIIICYIGNGKGHRLGVDEGALPYYIKFIDRFTDEEIKIFLRLFDDIEFTQDMNKTIPITRLVKLCQKLFLKATSVLIKNALDFVANYDDYQKICHSIDYNALLKNIPN